MCETREKLLEVKDLHVQFGKGRKRFEAIKGVSFDIYKGETFGLVGESGSGKTTIGRAIIRINPVSSGEILFKGKRIRQNRQGNKQGNRQKDTDDLSGPHGLAQRARKGGLHRFGRAV